MSKSKGKMRSKTKIGVRKPPLSVIDKLIYGMGFLLAIAVGIGVIPFSSWLYDAIAFRDPAVVAVTGVFLPVAVLLFGLGCMLQLFWCLGRQLHARQPIFGNSKVTYGVFPWKKDLFPLFGTYPEKEKLKKDTFQMRKKRKERLILFAICAVAFMLMEIYLGATVAALRDDHSVTVFRVSEESMAYAYTAEDFDNLTIGAHYHTAAKAASYYDLSMKIIMKDGKSYRFCIGTFRGGEAHKHIEALEAMTEIKALFPPEAITIEKEQKADYLIDRYDYDAEHARMLRELFEAE